MTKNNSEIYAIVNTEEYRALTLRTKDTIKKYGFWKVLWGTDIFVNDIPFMKTILALNILVWLMFLIK